MEQLLHGLALSVPAETATALVASAVACIKPAGNLGSSKKGSVPEEISSSRIFPCQSDDPPPGIMRGGESDEKT